MTLFPLRSIKGSGNLGAKSYHYRELKNLEIRLIKVMPEKMPQLKCEIVHKSLNNVPTYTAISVSIPSAGVT
jgi:hypothetical protein